MKVYELLYESNIKEVIVKKMPSFHEDNMVGTGSEAEVFDGGDSNSVIKVVDYYHSRNDSTYHYIDAVMDNQDNPFLPKIYGAKIYMTPESKDSYLKGKLVIRMEQLHPFGTIKNAHIMQQLLKQLGIDPKDTIDPEKLPDYMFDKPSPEDIKRLTKTADKVGNVETNFTGEFADKEQDQNDIKNLSLMLGRVLQKQFSTTAGREELIKKATSPELKQALQISHDIVQNLKDDKDERETDGDLHHENIMIRYTQHGPQLVIVDPVISWWV